MKTKFFLIVVCALFANLAGYAYATSAVLLQHEGQVKTFDNVDLLKTAIEEAVEGDTIFLGVGIYPSFTLTKKVTICGVGDGKTIINGGVTINVLSTGAFEASSLIGLKMGTDGGSNISINSSSDGLEIKQCSFNTLSFKGKHDNFKLISCLCNGYLNMPNDKNNSLNSAVILNSKIRYVAPSSSTNVSPNVYLKNCDILGFYSNGAYCDARYFKGTLENCIIGLSPGYNDGRWFSNMTMLYTLYESNFYTISQNVYTGESNTNFPVESSQSFIDKDLKCIYTPQQLEELKYIGSDGTIIGCYGGTYPYTLTLPVPKVNVKRSTVVIDDNERVLKVDITVTPAN